MVGQFGGTGMNWSEVGDKHVDEVDYEVGEAGDGTG